MYLGQSFNYSSKALSLGLKVVVNQIVFAPIFNTYFFGMSSILAGDTLAKVWGRIKDTVPISVFNSLKLWPAVTAFNFTYVQPQYRALFADLPS
jgi:protein Mpv17